MYFKIGFSWKTIRQYRIASDKLVSILSQERKQSNRNKKHRKYFKPLLDAFQGSPLSYLQYISSVSEFYFEHLTRWMYMMDRGT